MQLVRSPAMQVLRLLGLQRLAQEGSKINSCLGGHRLMVTASSYASVWAGPNAPAPLHLLQQTPQQHLPEPYASQQEQHLGTFPQLCAVPKHRVTIHRRGQRRVWYYLKHKPSLTQCQFCGAVGAKDQVLTGLVGNCQCTGRCLGPQRKYQPEYKPPV